MLVAALKKIFRLGRTEGSVAVDPAREPPDEGSVPQETAPETAVAEAVPEGALSYAQALRKLYELAFGINPLELPSQPEHTAVAAAARKTLAAAAHEPRYAPRRPMLLPQLMQAVNDNDVSRRSLAALIVRDPALTGNLLKLANSPFYRVSSEPVESIERAIALLGTEGIRSLIATAIMQPVFRVAGGEFARFPEIIWDHTFRAGTAAAACAAMLEDEDPFAAQLLALVSGLAAIVVFRVALDEYRSKPLLRPQAGLIASLLDAHAAPLARDIAAGWELSQRVLDALAEQKSAVQARDMSPLGRALHLGQLLGALALLKADGSIEASVAQATVAACSGSGRELAGIWTRLSARPAGSQAG